MSEKQEGPELYFGLVGAVGTDLAKVINILKSQLAKVKYNSREIILSELICENKKFKHLKKLRNGPEEERIKQLMDAGTKIRELINDHEYNNEGKITGNGVARLAIAKIIHLRKISTGNPKKPISRQAYILKSLKHPDEVKLLRKVFGEAFFLISVYEPKHQRIKNLAVRIAKSHGKFLSKKFRKLAESLIEIDEKETDKELGQRVTDTFHRADYFIDQNKDLELQLGRSIDLLFGARFKTPTKDEYCMVHAQVAALRSSDLSRQVGAVIATKNGEIISAGCNEVPKAGGGTYWEGDDPDYRDFKNGTDPSAIMKSEILTEIFSALKDNNWLSEDKNNQDPEELTREAFGEDGGILKQTRISDILEYGRIIHAEMLAIIDAARRGLNIKDKILYSTTFPCHVCARHIIGAGIKKVIYIEPYPKSLTKDLYANSVKIAHEKDCDSNALEFQPYFGLAPKKYFLFFEKLERKDKEGTAFPESYRDALPRLGSNYKVPRNIEKGYIESLEVLEK